MRNVAVTDVLVGFVGGAVDCIGIVGNVSMLVVLCSKPAEKPMYIILRTMSVTNILILALNAVFQALPVIWRVIGTVPTSMYYFAYMYGHYMWITATAIHFVKVWLTVLLSIERWTAVCHPLAFSNSFLTRRIRWLIALIGLSAILFTIPRGFERECVYAAETGVIRNLSYSGGAGSGLKAQLCQWRPTALAKSQLYSYGYGVVAYAVCVFLFPVTTTLVLNGHIIYELRRGKTIFANLSIVQKNERRISKVPLAVAIIFCVLQTPAMVVNLFEFAGFADSLGLRSIAWRSLLAATAILILVDSSADFIVYFYNIRCSTRTLKFRARAKSAISNAESATNANRSSSNVCLNEMTMRKLLLVHSDSRQHLTIKTYETSSCKKFYFNLL